MEQTIGKIKPRTYDLLYDLAREFSIPGEIIKAKKIMESVLHSFAEGLDVDKGIEVMTTLPVHLKDTFSKAWKPFSPVKKTDFISSVQAKLANTLICTREQAILMVYKVFTTLKKYISPDKIIRIYSCMNDDLKAILDFTNRK
jgi:uncharacterized protein (DUF2267 family)